MSHFERLGDLSAMTYMRLAVAALALCCVACPPKCPQGQTDCEGYCANLDTDKENCGLCGKLCAREASCDQGTCACPSATPTACGRTCVDLQVSNDHCGACGHACGLGTCMAGGCVCATVPASVTRCTTSSPECVDTSSDSRHCGACDAGCTGGKTCTASTCGCPASKPTECTGVCSDTMTDLQNCGGCGLPCTRANGTCDAGMCGCPSSASTFCATSNACANVMTDKAHCGSCTTPCTRDGGSCAGGMCTCPAGAPNFCIASDTCTDFTKDPLNCGSCGFRCQPGLGCNQSVCCGDGGVVCAGTCCSGGACCPGNVCPTRHSNGLGGQFFNCNPIGSHDPMSQKQAADAWKPGTDLGGVPCVNTLCLKREAVDQCALFCADGIVTASPVGSIVCLCAEQGAVTVSSWN